MRIVTLIVAALASIVAVVMSRRAAAEAKKQAKFERRLHAVEHAAHQKPGLVVVPKIPKVKRYS
ncbi:hypothetical protein [Frondihabitans australicus]|uniref:Uncharacterized protein n=1 Tax=Frondihabitans australicus TaxID=386892 RepID=A0A495IGE4_9MICO|nr:hypothetical protein [Frondihabitans australicus]RKR74275.1 hypothetical protein C8E83_1384 [Frondihabitans australicus]